MNIDFSKLLLYGFLTLIVLVILAIYSVKLSMNFIVDEEKDTYDGFRISDIKPLDSTGDSISIEVEEK